PPPASGGFCGCSSRQHAASMKDAAATDRVQPPKRGLHPKFFLARGNRVEGNQVRCNARGRGVRHGFCVLVCGRCAQGARSCGWVGGGPGGPHLAHGQPGGREGDQAAHEGGEAVRASLVHLALGMTLCFAARAHDAAHHHPPEAVAPASAKVTLSEAPLLDQGGRRVRLAKDVIGERIAVVNFIYTSCTTVCPVSSATFQQLQQRLAASLGKEVVLVSITVDPLRDTPQRLREYGARYRAAEGWTWLTGAKPDVDGALKGFGAYTPNFEDHPATVLVGDARAGKWTRFFGFPSVDDLVARIEAIQAAREAGKVAHHHGKE